jgi:hypothetical protein
VQLNQEEEEEEEEEEGQAAALEKGCSSSRPSGGCDVHIQAAFRRVSTDIVRQCGAIIIARGGAH